MTGLVDKAVNSIIQYEVVVAKVSSLVENARE